MKVRSIVRPPMMTSKDREFENLLRRAAELLNRRSSDRGRDLMSDEKDLRERLPDKIANIVIDFSDATGSQAGIAADGILPLIEAELASARGEAADITAKTKERPCEFCGSPIEVEMRARREAYLRCADASKLPTSYAVMFRKWAAES